MLLVHCDSGQTRPILFRIEEDKYSKATRMSSLVVPIGIAVNILSVVGIVILNKYITEVDQFDFMVFLSFLHFVFTGIGTYIMLKLDLFQYKAADQASVMPVALGSLLSVAFMNLNLSSNSVGFFQVRERVAFLKPNSLPVLNSPQTCLKPLPLSHSYPS